MVYTLPDLIWTSAPFPSSPYLLHFSVAGSVHRSSLLEELGLLMSPSVAPARVLPSLLQKHLDQKKKKSWLLEKNSTSVIKNNYLGGITSERPSPTMSCSPSIICCKENQVHPLLDHQSTLCSGLITWACDFYEYLTPLWEKAMAAHCSTLAWEIPWRRSLVDCSPWGR